MFVPCKDCGKLRRIKGYMSAIRDARKRRCVACGRVKGAKSFIERNLEVDEMAVERMLSGNPPASTTRSERIEAVRYLTERGVTATLIAERLGITTRSVQRMRAAARLQVSGELMAA